MGVPVIAYIMRDCLPLNIPIIIVVFFQVLSRKMYRYPYPNISLSITLCILG